MNVGDENILQKRFLILKGNEKISYHKVYDENTENGHVEEIPNGEKLVLLKNHIQQIING